MFRQLIFPSESFVAFVGLERPLPCVLLHVALHISSCYTIVVTMVALLRLLSCVSPQYVTFQVTFCYAGILALITFVQLLPYMLPLYVSF